jgi:ketosteroid isomerase-like protein
MIRYALRLAIEAANSSDYEAAFALILSPDYETVTPPELVGLGFEPTYRGREGRLRFQLKWVGELGEFQQETEEIIDCGDRVLLLARMRGSGLSSGAAFDSEVAYLLTISGGRLIREQDFRSHEEALEAAGLSG